MSADAKGWIIEGRRGDPYWYFFTLSKTRRGAIFSWNRRYAHSEWDYTRMRKRGELMAVKVHLIPGWEEGGEG